MSQYVPGLEGIVAVQTALSSIDGQQGQLMYRGYDVRKLATQHTYEDVWYMLLKGQFPTSEQHSDFVAAVQAYAVLPHSVSVILKTMPNSVPFVSVVRSALSAAYSGWGLHPSMDLSPEELEEDCLRTAVITPLVIAAAHRIRQGLQPVPYDPNESWPANFVHMLTDATPTPNQTKTITRYMILVVDHGLNASTFTARVIASTGADVGAAIVGAIGALSGPLHGGAPSLVLDMLDDIGPADQAVPWAENKIKAKQKIMGFGHRVYKTYDPRAHILKATAEETGAPRYDDSVTIEEAVTRTFAELKPGRNIYPNVEYYSAIALDGAGLSRELFTPTFVASRTVGWTAHILEQANNNRLMRPRAEYIGPMFAQAVS